MKDYDIFFKGTYFGTAKNMPEDAESAVDMVYSGHVEPTSYGDMSIESINEV